MLIKALAAAAGNFGGGYSIEDSLRFNDNDSAYLSRTPATASNRKTWTWSGWVKRGLLADRQGLFSAGLISGTYNYHTIHFDSNDKLNVVYYPNTTSTTLITTQVFRDPSAWYHIVVAWDTTQATASNRVKVYVNGAQVTAFGTATYSSQNTDGFINSTAYNSGVHLIGRFTPNDTAYFDGYMAEVNFVDGQALTPDDFGEINEDTGEWSPIEYEGTYGTNGFYLPFDGNANDSSGNGNNWTENNLASTDYMISTPTNSFSVLNPLSGFGGGTFSEGNLSLNTTPAGNNVSTIAVSSGKWYFEGRVKLDNFYAVGITNEAGVTFSSSISASGSNSVGYWSGGGIYDQGGLVATVASYGTADVASAAIDMDTGNVKFYKNNVLVYTYTFGVSGAGITFDTLFAAVNGGGGASRSVDVNFGADSSFAGNKTRQVNTDENGIGDFYYEPPAGGYLALCSDNLPAAAIVQPQTQFNVVTWTGNGTSQAITGVGFQPDMVWIKVRSTNYDHQIHDSVRGAGLGLLTNSTAAELNYATVTSFDSDGFTVDASSYIGTNASGETFVAWCWKAGGTAVSNTDGSITSQVSANVDSGFSVVSYTGTGANATVGHGLSSAPEMMLVKDRDSTFTWRVYHASLANTQVLYLSGTDAATTETATWNSTSPTSTVLSLGTSGGTNGSSLNYIAYCFHSVEGFSKFGSYVGNGSDNGTFVYTGFKPAFVLVKRTDSTGNWVLKDTARDTDNPAGFTLLADVADAEYGTSNTSLDILSNGFKPRTTSALVNASGGTYIYMAFAEHPFNYATGR